MTTNILEAILKQDSHQIVNTIRQSLQSKSLLKLQKKIQEEKLSFEKLNESNLKILEKLSTGSQSKVETLQFKNGDEVDIDFQTAKGLYTLYSSINPAQKKKFEDSLEKNLVTYMQLIKFAKDKNIL
jgi:transcription antitermination factor NusG